MKEATNKNIFDYLKKRETGLLKKAKPSPFSKGTQTDYVEDFITLPGNLMVRYRPNVQEMALQAAMNVFPTNARRTPGGVPYVVSPYTSPFIGAEERPATNVRGSFKKGGVVTKTGLYKVHKNEVVIPSSRVKSVEKVVKNAGMKSLKK